jgi:hypothetical protein
MNWDHIRDNVKKAAEKTADQLNYSADLATLQVKLTVEERKLAQAYAELGKIAYRHFSEDESKADEVAGAMLLVEKEIQAVKMLKIRILTLKKQRIEKMIEENKKIEKEAMAAQALPTEQAEEVTPEDPIPEENV